MRRAALSITILVLTVASCGTGAGDQTRASESTTPPATGSAAATPTDAPTASPSTPEAPTEAPRSAESTANPEFPKDITKDMQSFTQGSGARDLVLTDVRVAEQDGFDRIVLEFAGTGSPGWSVNYADNPRADGSGSALPVEGDAFLDIFASRMGDPQPTTRGEDYDGPLHFQPDDGGAVEDVYVVGRFEGAIQVTVGIDGDAVPFQVSALVEPSRLVVDVGVAPTE